jgi:hypothetical protein
MDKKRRFRKKFWALFLALALVISSLPLGIATGFVETAYAATRGTLKQTNLSQYNFKSSKFMEILVANYQRGTTYIGSCSEGGLQMHKFEVGDMLVFCMEHGVVQKDVTLKAVPYEQSDFAAAYKNDGYEYAVDNMFRILMYAPTNESSLSELTNELGFKDSKYYGENGTPTMGSWIAAVQMLVWESQQLMRDEDFNRVDNGLYYQDSWNGNRTTPIKRNHYTTNLTGKPAIDIYNFIASEIKKGTNFDRTIASLQKSKPTAITVPEDATYPLTITLTAGSYAGDYKIVDEKGKEIEGLSLSYNKAAKEYSLTIENSNLLDQVFTVKHNDGLVQRAERYLNGPNGNDYRPYFWEYATTNGHTQGFISGFDDPEEGFLTLKSGAAPVKPELGTCEPPDVDVFPTLYIPIDKQDANPGFDGDVSTPMGDAGLDATYTLERQIAGGGWEVIDVISLDDLGSEHVFQDQPFASLTDLESYMTEEGTVSGCAAHPIYGGENGDEIIGYEHESESREPQKRIWDVTVGYRITEERPDGRYIDPDAYAGMREYSFTYHAETEDTCSYFCEDLPWTEVEYTFDYVTTLGAGGSYTESGNAPSDELSYDKETFVNDVFRGDIQIIKSNEKYNPFKDSTLGGSENNISIATYWTVKLEAGSEEGDGYVHLVSADPEVLSGGTHQYTVSRTPGVHNGQNPMVVGSNGTLILKDVPYGTYTVTEVKAEDPMYVLEQFTVTVDEHSGNNGPVNSSGLFAGYNQAGTNAIGSNAAGTGDYFNNRYDVNLRDKVKSNVIKVEKYDSETGKIIYPGEDGKIKVFIRYKGNPDYTDEQNQALYGPNGTEAKGIYNRFLPNAESIDSKSTNYTFELDENGEITIAYELPYGIYEICEWLLPEGYYVGKYNEKGEGSSYDFGYIAENIVKVDPGSDGYSKTDTYSVYDSDGKAITFKDKSEYSFEDLASMVVNSYTFTVTEQEMHVDGNYSQLVTYEGVRSEADGSYEKSDYPYTKYYKVAAIINNSVKGKIEITKKGEKLVGFTEEEKDGYKVLTPVFEVATGIKDTVFGIFAAKDITLFDGSEGPAIFDAATDEKIVIKKEAVSNLSNAVETVKAFFGKLLNPKEFQAANYETGSFDHESGAMLWYMLEREASEGNVKRTIYVTPEQKDTTYQYSYTANDGDFNYLWNVEVAMNNQAGGRNVTKVNITKTTEVALGYTDEIPLSYMSGTVGDTVLSPVESFMKEADPLSWENSSRLESYDRTYIFEADGNVEIYADGTSYEDAKYTYSDNTEVDLAKHTPDRYQVKYYDYYKLTESDLLTEERVTGTHQEVLVPGSDENDDGDFDDPDDIPPIYQDVEDKETKTIFEWENGISLISPAAGGKAIYQDAASGKYYAAAEGYSQGGTYTSLAGLTGFTFIESDEYGDALLDFVVPDGWSLVPFAGDKDKEPHYVIITQTDAETGATVYRVLLSDMINWQKCTPEGNFVKAAVQVYQVKYIQEAGDADGFTLDWDGFKLETVSSGDAAVTTITKHAPSVLGEYVDLGAGYDYEDLGDAIKFWTIPVTAPIYFESADGIRTQMYYKGGMAHTTITMPESAVDHLYKTPVPSLNFIHVDSEGETTEKYLDWYSALTPSTPIAEFGTRIGLPEGVSVTAKRHEGTSAGEHTYYTIDIVTNQTEETPLEVTFADEYKMRIYTAKAASGNGVGVIDLFNTYKTTVHTKTELIETITTDENGVAHSSLLPLGEYIVRELTADDNYVNEQEDKNVVLSYKDQFTPVVWEKDEFTNKYFTVEIDFSKVFETAFKSDEYQPPKEGEVVKFGLYAAEKITSKVSASSEVSKKSVNKDTLIDVFTVSYENGGNSLASVKLPEGAYYLKELEAPEKYIMSNLRYNFVVKEDAGDYSDVTDFDFSVDDGITGKFILEEKGHVKTTIRIENRLPMPEILINGASFPLDAAYSDEFIAIDVDSDYTEVFIDTFKGETLDVTLPNGKALKVEPGDNTFDYTVDGVKNTFIPTVTYTGYHAIYEEGWKSVKGEDLTDYSVNFTLTGAGTDKDSLILDVTVNHLASKTVTVKEELIDPARPELGYHEVTTEKGNLSKSGYQIFKHEASFFVKDSLGNNVTPLTYERISDGTASSETLDPAVSNEITLTAKDKILLTTASGAIVTVSMDKNGIVTASIENMLTSGFADDKNAEAVSTGASSSHLDFAKNVTLGRQDTSSDKLMIKINSDGQDSFAIENDHKPHVVFEKVDAENPLKKLSGARFEIYSAKSIGDWAAEPDALIGEYVTDASGKFSMTLDYGVYYYREVAAPSGYKLNTDFVKFRVIKGEDPFTIVVENEKIPYTPGVPVVPVVPTPGPGQQVFTLEIIKIDGDTGARLAGAEFELYGSSIVGGKLVRDEEPILTMVTGELGLVTAELVKAGTYYYRETMAPAGYACDTSFHTVEVKDAKVITSVTMENYKGKPVIGTQAAGPDGEKEIVADGYITIIDTVSYSNLTPGLEYILKGTLMNKETGKALKADGKKVTAETVFIPEEPNGTASVTFRFDASGIKDLDTVVFEKLYVRNYDDDGGKPKEELVTTHEDIEDEGQTVFLCEKPEEEPEPEGPGKIGKLELTTDDTYDEHEQANVPRTGDDSMLYIQFYLGMMLISLAGLLAILFRFDIRKK